MLLPLARGDLFLHCCATANDVFLDFPCPCSHNASISVLFPFVNVIMLFRSSSYCDFEPPVATMVKQKAAAVAAVSGPTADDFRTPDRSKLSTHFEEKKDGDSNKNNNNTGTDAATGSIKGPPSVPTAATVTPSESFMTATRKDSAASSNADPSNTNNGENENDSSSNNNKSATEDNKHVRFDKEDDAGSEASPSSSVGGDSPSKRGLVSRRGGRCASPGRSLATSGQSKDAHAAATAVLEFKTFRSPDRKPRDENDTVPSLCSTSSVEPKEEDRKPSAVADKETNNENDESKKVLQRGLQMKPTSITYEQSSNNKEASKKPSSTATADGQAKKTSVTFSPVPAPRDAAADRVSRLPLDILLVSENL